MCAGGGESAADVGGAETFRQTDGGTSISKLAAVGRRGPSMHLAASAEGKPKVSRILHGRNTMHFKTVFTYMCRS